MKFKLLLVLILFNFSVYAQQKIQIGETRSFHSEILDENRKLEIYLPESYTKGEKTYPVLYLQDSYYNFTHAVGTVEYLVLNQLIPEMIIVGILNTRRIRDLTPASHGLSEYHMNRLPNRGGADNYLNFMEKELKPFVEENYRAAPYNILVGHSLGGLLNTYCFFKKPNLFNAYLTISPSLWYTNNLLDKELDEVLKDHQEIDSKFYLTIANEGGTMLGNVYKLAGKFESYISENKEVDLKFKFETMFEQTHGSLGLPSIFNGLQFIFEDLEYELPENKEVIFAKNGLQEMIEEIQDHYAKLSREYGFRISDEGAMNNLGYTFFNKEGFEDAAVKVFKLNADNHPDSFNAYSNLGAAYEKAGNIEEARKYYEKALKMVKATGDPEWEFYQNDLDDLNAQEKKESLNAD